MSGVSSCEVTVDVSGCTTEVEPNKSSFNTEDTFYSHTCFNNVTPEIFHYT